MNVLGIRRPELKVLVMVAATFGGVVVVLNEVLDLSWDGVRPRAYV